MVHDPKKSITVGKTTFRKATKQDQRNFEEQGREIERNKKTRSSRRKKRDKERTATVAPKKVDRSIKAQIGRLRSGATGNKFLDSAAGKILGDPTTTLTLAATAATLGVGGAAFGGFKAANAASKFKPVTLRKGAGGAFDRGVEKTLTRIDTQRRATALGKKIPTKFSLFSNKIPSTASIAERFPQTGKAIVKTERSLLQKGIRGATVAFIVGAFGTYPFAAWGKQEVLGGLKINARDAREAGDFEMAEELIAMREEMHEIDWHDFIPYENVLEKFREFTKADILAVESEKRLLAHERGELDFEGLSVGEQIEIRAIESQRQFEENQASIQEASEGRASASQAQFEENQASIKKSQEERDKRFDGITSIVSTLAFGTEGGPTQFTVPLGAGGKKGITFLGRKITNPKEIKEIQRILKVKPEDRTVEDLATLFNKPLSVEAKFDSHVKDIVDIIKKLKGG